jgi:hypothetical protein
MMHATDGSNGYGVVMEAIPNKYRVDYAHLTNDDSLP